ncbi:Gamma interferon inducible lysosomal thiol reductase GILT [Penicillium macrosclerotiorum]|uniref:Gamma interferon inducible lysosomal thiol reductase GILT n=1 Tax=Penicillium macrosclerotiorum TaxID=303699 RepID=UPI002548BA9A|nr:Gamma interferon inducible lysosomal thiol reductase GILT [Penicillium macrosclerotiorum]KAJ5690502.1 Gamma interferon inducible lysosomal thiol reductase GILT [Penicillium macrosclerotiorum]
MEKLPLHSEEAIEASSEPRWTTQRPRPSRNTMIWRYTVVFTFLICYYLLLRPTVYEPSTPGHVPRFTPAQKFWPFFEENTPEEQTPVEQPQSESQGYLENLQDQQRPLAGTEEHFESKIPLEAHIMSKCPDAKDCLQKLVLPAMEQISEKVAFNLSFIASVSKESSEIECMHGPGECIGDMLMLCAANLPFPPTADESLLPQAYPRTPIIRSLGFANCLINNYPRIPDRDFVHECALEHGIDFDSLNKCASQQDDAPSGGGQGQPFLSGLALLRESALHSQKLGAKTSCTVRLDDTVWCIRDGGKWKDCVQGGQGANPQMLIDEVNRLWKERN